MNLNIKDLTKNGYVFLDKFEHRNFKKFLADKNKGKAGFFSVLFLVSIIIPIFYSASFLTYNILSGEIELTTGLLFCLMGIISSFIFIPIHESIHALAYKMVGTKNVTFYLNFREFVFAATSDKSIINLTEFRTIALLPYFLVLIFSTFLLFNVEVYWQILVLFFLTVHNFMCSGDFSLLNFMEKHRTKGIITFDDNERGETYFYINGNK